jgi:PTS system nitrogen regulatory IIA component
MENDMQLSDHLLRENVAINLAFSSKKDLLDRLAGLAAEKVGNTWNSYGVLRYLFWLVAQGPQRADSNIRNYGMVNAMNLQDFLPLENVIVGFRADTKLQILRQLSAIAGRRTGLDPQKICLSLLEREKLGSTGIGEGIAIPHARLEELEEPLCLFAKLSRPVDFEAMDDQPIDIVVLLLCPAEAGREAVTMLSSVARRFRDERVLAGVCQAASPEEVYEALVGVA